MDMHFAIFTADSEVEAAKNTIKGFGLKRLKNEIDEAQKFLGKATEEADDGNGFNIMNTTEITGSESERKEKYVNANTLLTALHEQYEERLEVQANVQREVPVVENAVRGVYGQLLQATNAGQLSKDMIGEDVELSNLDRVLLPRFDDGSGRVFA